MRRRRRRKISQSEAHRLLARVHKFEALLESMRNAYVRDWPDESVHLLEIGVGDTIDAAEFAAVHTARKLRHAVMVTTTNGKLQLYAVMQPGKREQP